MGTSLDKFWIVNLATKIITLGNASGTYETDTLANIENASGTDNNDTFYGDDKANRFVGGAGADMFAAGLGNDVIDGGSGTDRLHFAQSTYSTFFGGSSFNGADTIDLATGSATRSLTYRTSSLFSPIGSFSEVTTFTGIEVIYAGDGSDKISGTTGGDTVYGEAGADEFRLGFGADVVDGGDGEDTLYFVNSGTINWSLFNGDDTIRLDQGFASHSLVLTGGTIWSQRTTFAGIERIFAGDGNDIVVGGVNRDVIYGDIGRDNLSGYGGTNEIYGGDGDDILSGGDGADVLSGGNGNDDINVGDGADVIVFQAGGGTDTIHDWTNGVDRFDLRQVSGITSFAQLTVLNSGTGISGAGVTISFAGTLINLPWLDRSYIDASDFLFA